MTSETPTAELATIDATTGVRKVVTRFDVPFDPAWSPSGTDIAFASQHGVIYVVHPDGSGLQQVTGPPANCLDDDPGWSPDSAQLVFSRDCTGPDGVESTRGSGLFTVHLDSTDSTQITTQQANSRPSWSPGGTIAFEVWNRATRTSSVYVVQSDGTGEREFVGDAGSPIWSPDGRYLAVVTSNRIRVFHPDATLVGGIAEVEGLEVSSFDWTRHRVVSSS
ncbi:MAG TPA: hypothetical protein VGH10_09875 [Actinomycetota bacterium]